MNKKIKDKWVKALLSGKYHQGTKRLKGSNDSNIMCHCCLGVLCELYSKEHPKEEKFKLKDVNSSDYYISGERYYLPKKIMEWAELEEKDPVVEVDYEHDEYSSTKTLSFLNDSHYYNFHDIARFIKNQL